MKVIVNVCLLFIFSVLVQANNETVNSTFVMPLETYNGWNLPFTTTINVNTMGDFKVGVDMTGAFSFIVTQKLPDPDAELISMPLGYMNSTLVKLKGQWGTVNITFQGCLRDNAPDNVNITEVMVLGTCTEDYSLNNLTVFFALLNETYPMLMNGRQGMLSVANFMPAANDYSFNHKLAENFGA